MKPKIATALGLLALSGTALAQTYPVQTPTYIPTARLLPQTLSAAGSTTAFVTQNAGTLVARLSGTFTGLSGTFQATNDATPSATGNWVNISAQPISPSGGRISLIASAGTYKVATTGYTGIRFTAAALSTGSVTLALSATSPENVIDVLPARRPTYSATKSWTPYTGGAATDFLTLTGSATATVRVLRVECSGTSTAAATINLQGVLRSTADTGTATAVTPAQHDTNDPAPTAIASIYTANPTLGTLNAALRSGTLTTVTAATTALTPNLMAWDFGVGTGEEVTLRGAAQEFALNGNGSTFTAGAVLNCTVIWTEE